MTEPIDHYAEALRHLPPDSYDVDSEVAHGLYAIAHAILALRDARVIVLPSSMSTP